MNSLRVRIRLIAFLALGIVSFTGYKTYKSFTMYSVYQTSLATSYRLSEFTKYLVYSDFKLEYLKNLKKHREALTEKPRMERLSDVIQAYANRNPHLLRKRVNAFTRNESEFRSYLYSQLKYIDKMIRYFGSICFTTMLTSILLLLVYTLRYAIRPITDLKDRMMDFLNNRYTYQFSTPSNNEVGHLQATFNSLAQRVLTNLEELKALDNAKSEFLSIASHELRTPLTSIKGSLSLLKNGFGGKIEPSSQKLLSIAETETDRLIRLINDLLDLAKIEAGQFPLTREWVSLREVVQETLEGVIGLANTAGVGLKLMSCPNVDVLIDKDRIQQILMNLMSNAVKYNPKGKTVFVHVNINENQEIMIEVQDQGKGIAPEDQALIFEQFRQATNSKNPLVKGTGLGLAIAKALVEEHGGHISVKSVVGCGSTFYFTLVDWRQAETVIPTLPEEAAA